MPNISGMKNWSSVRLLETHELARGGVNGNLNEQAKALADRTEFLLDAIGNVRTANYYKSYPTLALANADIANIPIDGSVKVLSISEGGDYYKETLQATSLTKSAYDPVQILTALIESKISVLSVYETIDAYLEVQLDENGNSRIKLYSDEHETVNYDSRIEQSISEISDLKLKTEGISVYETIKGFITVFVDENGNSRVKELSIDDISESFITSKQKKLISGTGIGLIETDDAITIEVGNIDYETPHEYVLCLIAGQSNASYYGGNENLAPSMPNGICYVWDFTNNINVLRDINDGSAASITCKKTYGPALALEFYKQTGLGLIIVNSAVGSTAQTAEADNGAGNWSPVGTLRQLAVTRFNACKNYLDANGYCYQNGFIVWTQGERDGQEIQINTITKLQYKTGLSEMIDFFKTNLGLKLPFIITTTAYYATTGDNSGSKSVRAAQSEIAHEKAGVFLGFTGAVKFFERNLMDDNVHYNQIGKNILGKALGKISSKLSAGVN